MGTHPTPSPLTPHAPLQAREAIFRSDTIDSSQPFTPLCARPLGPIPVALVPAFRSWFEEPVRVPRTKLLFAYVLLSTVCTSRKQVKATKCYEGSRKKWKTMGQIYLKMWASIIRPTCTLDNVDSLLVSAHLSWRAGALSKKCSNLVFLFTYRAIDHPDYASCLPRSESSRAPK